jgi:hypothetical protein
MRPALLGILLTGALAATAAAQSVAGRVTLQDSTTGLVGATITLRSSTGSTVGQVASGSEGRYAVSLPGPGEYELQSIRIGYQPIRLKLAAFVRGEERTVDLVMVAQPYQLAELGVTAEDPCRMSSADRERFVQLWTRAGSALGPHLAEAGGTLAVRVLQVEGTEDGPLTEGRRFPIWNPNNRRPEVDSLLAREDWTDRFFGRTPAEELMAIGYARADAFGEVEYDVPNPEVLLSEGFLARYCFGLERGPRSNPDWVGIRFRPKTHLDSLTDVTGTLWLDQITAEIRHLDFEYHNLPRIPFRNCVSSNRPARIPTGQWRFGPSCFEFIGGERVPRPPEGTGGSIAFVILPSGEWVVHRWTLRTAGQTFVDRPAGYRLRPVRGRTEICYDRPPDCRQIFLGVPRLIVTTGAIATIVHDGVEVFHDDTTLAALDRIAALQAQPRPGHVAGVVIDAVGHPVPRAVVASDSPTRAAITDSAGRFELRTLPTRELNFSVTRPGFQPLGFRLPILADSTRQVTVTLVPSPSGVQRE